MNENKNESIDNKEVSSDANMNQKSHNSSQTKKHILITWLIATGVLFTLFLINIFIIKFDMGLNSKLDNFLHPSDSLKPWNQYAYYIMIALTVFSFIKLIFTFVYNSKGNHPILVLLSLFEIVIFSIAFILLQYPLYNFSITNFILQSIGIVVVAIFLYSFTKHKNEDIFQLCFSSCLFIASVILWITNLLFIKESLFTFMYSSLCILFTFLKMVFKRGDKNQLNCIRKIIEYVFIGFMVVLAIIDMPIITSLEKYYLIEYSLPLILSLILLRILFVIKRISNHHIWDLILFCFMGITLGVYFFFLLGEHLPLARLIVFCFLSVLFTVLYTHYLSKKNQAFLALSAGSLIVNLIFAIKELQSLFVNSPIFCSVAIPSMVMFVLAPVMYNWISKASRNFEICLILEVGVALISTVLLVVFKKVLCLNVVYLLLVCFALSIDIYNHKHNLFKNNSLQILFLRLLEGLIVCCIGYFNLFKGSFYEGIRDVLITCSIIFMNYEVVRYIEVKRKKEFWVVRVIPVLFLSLVFTIVCLLFNFNESFLQAFIVEAIVFVYSLVETVVFYKDIDASDYGYIPLISSIVSLIISVVLLYFIK